MINITPTNYYNTNFKANTDYSKIYKEMEKLSLKQEKKILPKNTIKSKINLLFINQLHNAVLDILFKARLMRPIFKKYDIYGNTMLKEYKHNAYRKYDYKHSWGYSLYIKEEQFPSGLKKYYEHDGLFDESSLSKEILPNGTIRNYEIMWNYSASFLSSKMYKNYLVQEILPDGTMKIFQKGNLIQVIAPDGKIIKSNLYT